MTEPLDLSQDNTILTTSTDYTVARLLPEPPAIARQDPSPSLRLFRRADPTSSLSDRPISAGPSTSSVLTTAALDSPAPTSRLNLRAPEPMPLLACP